MKSCVNCKKVLYNNAVICPRCGFKQPPIRQAVPFYRPKSVAKKKTDIAKLQNTALKIGILLGAFVFAAVVLLFSYQVLWSGYINKNIENWTDTFKSSATTMEDFSKLEKDMSKFPPNKFNVFGLKRVGEKLCKDYDDYNDMCDGMIWAKDIKVCHDEYLKWQETRTYKISDEANETMDYLYMYEDTIHSYKSAECMKQYVSWFDMMIPSEKNFEMTMYSPSFQSPYCECKVKNNNAFSIWGFRAIYNFTIDYFGGYYGYETSASKLVLKSDEELKSGQTKEYQVSFDPDDHKNNYHSYDYWQVHDESLVLDEIGKCPDEASNFS